MADKFSKTTWRSVAHLAIAVENERWVLPHSLQQRIDRYWNELLAKQTGFFRGPVLHVKRVHSHEQSVRIDTIRTDYAHHLYGRLLSEDSPYRVRVLFAAACLVTVDQLLIAGVMNSNMSRPGWIQSIGGSPTDEDIHSGYFNPIVSACREAEEEVAISLRPSDCRVGGFTQDDMNRIAVVVYMPLKQRAEDIIPEIKAYLKNQQNPELEDVLGLPLGPVGIKMLNSQTRPHVRYLETIVQGLYAGG